LVELHKLVTGCVYISYHAFGFLGGVCMKGLLMSC